MITNECSIILENSLKVLNNESLNFNQMELKDLLLERAMETPWVASKIRRMTNSNVLDVGFTFSSLDYMGMLLASIKKGTLLTGIDIISPSRVKNRYPLEWYDDIINVPFIKGDIRTVALPINSYDAILCISTIEHIGFDEERSEDGLGSFNRHSNPDYVQMKRDPELNNIVLNRFSEALNDNGKLLISVPMGKGGPVLLQDSLGLYCAQWEYEEASWNEIITHKSFELIEDFYFKLDENSGWQEVTSPKELVSQSSYLKESAAGCGLAMLQKK